MPQSGRDEEWLRVQLHDLGGALPDKEPLKPQYSTYSATWSQSEHDEAVLLLTQASEGRRNGEVKTLTTGGKTKPEKWAFEDYESVLNRVIGSSSACVGVIGCVLKYLNDHRPKRARRRSLKLRKSVTDDEMSSVTESLMMTALTHDQLDQVRVLAFFARAAGLDAVLSSALPTAIRMDNTRAVQILMEEGADTNTCSEDFAKCVHENKLDLIRLLLRSQKAVSNAITTNALPVAVELGNIETIQLLLAHGADADFKKGLALKHAIEVNRSDIITMLLLCANPPAEATLASMVSYVWSEPVIFAGRQGQLIELLLNGGASGNEVDAVLSGAVEQRWGEMVQLLMDKGTRISCCNGEAYRNAIHAVDYEMLQILDTDKLGADLATDIFGLIHTTQHGAGIPPQDWWKLATLLLGQGAAVRVRDLKSVKLLLVYGASVDYNDGRALGIAVKSGEMDYIVTILAHQPKIDTLNTAFPTVLAFALTTPICQRDHQFIEVLINGGADVGQREGFFIRELILLRGEFPITIAFSCIPLTLDLDERRRYKILQTLLDHGVRGGPIVAQALVDSIDESRVSSLAVAELLLTTGVANTAFNQGEAFTKAIKCQGPEFLQLLVQFNQLAESEFCSCLVLAIALPRDEMRLKKLELLLSAEVNMSAEHWYTALKQEMVREDPTDPYLLKSLLRANASVLHKNGECILHAVMKNDINSLEILQPHFINERAIVSRVFKTAWTKGARAESQEAALCLLLKAGATGKSLNVALVDTIETFDSSTNSLQLILDLLDAGADVNCDHGASLVKAAAKGNARLLTELFTASPTQNNMTLAFPNIFKSGVNGQTLTDMVHAFCSHSAKPDLAASSKPVLHLLLDNYPTEQALLKYMIDTGCPADTPVETSRGTYLSLLCWALAESKSKIGDEIIDTLLAAGADANYKTTSGHTPLGIAISTSRHQAVASLLRHGADPTVLYGINSPKSLLHLAVTTENAAIVRLILLASPIVNDGALHYAAREVNVEIMAILLNEGNTRDYEYSGCEGRTALAELCLKGDATKPQSELVRAMSLLGDSRNFKKRSNGKSALHYALDNQRNATAMTQALLDSGMGDYVNDEFNLYEQDGLIYSPLAYVSQGRNKASALVYRESLLKLLKQFGCKDRFWALEGNSQPADAINLPEEIARILAEKKDHERMLTRIREQSETAQAAIATQHELLLKNEQEISKQRSKLEKEAEARHLKMVASRRSAELAHIQNLAQQLGLGYHSSSDDALAQYTRYERERRKAELEHLTKQQNLITAAYKERADIEQKNREANAREMRRLRELWYEVDPWD
ncbi:hypothetical protein BJX68DRAFT_276918 [Aspergillus pseudodeflectus]|uniref:Ankyrin repeat-containing domain protein n=1 Tax=Aspergillus pseudodeflectus TaxID=176178 RepID=A0ABR4K3W0_9EURO